MDVDGVRTELSFDWGVASRPVSGESRSGDSHVVREVEDGLLIAVIDGLGHGDDAAHASALAVDALERHAAEPLERLAGRCHEELHLTRGAVMGLAKLLRSGNMTWLAIGDIEGVVVPEAGGDDRIRSLPQHRGIVGFNLPPLRAEVFELHAGDLLIVASDGVRPDGLRRRVGLSTPRWLADDILHRSARDNDDALVLIVRYRTPS
jgi:phosphoserine phosphatase RsbX